jgi:hypothetical protein
MSVHKCSRCISRRLSKAVEVYSCNWQHAGHLRILFHCGFLHSGCFGSGTKEESLVTTGVVQPLHDTNHCSIILYRLSGGTHEVSRL